MFLIELLNKVEWIFNCVRMLTRTLCRQGYAKWVFQPLFFQIYFFLLRLLRGQFAILMLSIKTAIMILNFRV